MENINNQTQSSAPRVPIEQTERKRDLTSYAEKYLLNIEGLNKQIEDKKIELATVSQQSMEKPAASKQAYVNLMSLIKKEVEELESQRDNLHTQKTIH